MTKLLSLISGGIDSPVAACLALEQGHEVCFVHFVNETSTDLRAKQKVFDLISFFAKKFKKKLKLFLVNHAFSLKEFTKNSNAKFTCIFCKRQMLRIASKLALKENCTALLMGDSLGQVASQTLFNLNAINSASSVFVSRPLIGLDKIEIEALAKKFGCFEISIKPALCCAFVPEQPSTKASIELIESEEKKFDLNSLIKKEFSTLQEKVFR